MGVFFSALDKREDDDVTINDVDIMFVDLFGVVCAEVDGESDEFLTGGLFSFLILFISAQKSKKYFIRFFFTKPYNSILLTFKRNDGAGNTGWTRFTGSWH